MQSVYVVANYKETQLDRLHMGQAVEISVDAYPDVTVRGHIESLAPGSGAQFALLPPENATGNFTKIVQRVPIKILIDQADPLKDRLRPGLSVIATVDPVTRAARVCASDRRKAACRRTQRRSNHSSKLRAVSESSKVPIRDWVASLVPFSAPSWPCSTSRSPIPRSIYPGGLAASLDEAPGSRPAIWWPRSSSFR